MRLNLQQVTNFRYPSRVPWILFLIALAVAIVLFIRLKTQERETRVATTAEERRPPQAELSSQPPSSTVKASRSGFVPDEAASAQLLQQGATQEAKGDLVGARRTYLQMLSSATSRKTREEVEKRLGRIGIELVLGPLPMPEKKEYTVQPGDSVEKIARRFGTTIEVVSRGSGLKDPNLLRVGQKLLVFTGRFSIMCSKSRNELVLFMNREFFKRYLVGTGKEGKTPTGVFIISEKVKEPVWWRPDGKEVPYGHPDNILGTRWMNLEATGSTPPVRGYGIHGTWDESTIGKSESQGCIRMRNADVEELYALVPLRTVVQIVE
ncbi:MAG: L,D-transpeptidase family protein [Kiritimatiellia bacterium]